MRYLHLILILLLASTADAQLFQRRFVQQYDYSYDYGTYNDAQPVGRLPGPRHSTGTGCDCAMCIGNHLRSVHGVHDLSGIGDWFAYHDNLHNAKLLIYAPTPQPLVSEIVKILDPQPHELFVDLGSGDGRVVVAAAKHGCDHAIGYELKPELVVKAKASVKAAGVHATINQESFLQLNLKTVRCVFVYLDEPMLKKAMRNLRTMVAGGRIVSYAHPLPGIKTQDVYWFPDGVLYAYRAPIGG